MGMTKKLFLLICPGLYIGGMNVLMVVTSLVLCSNFEKSETKEVCWG